MISIFVNIQRLFGPSIVEITIAKCFIINEYFKFDVHFIATQFKNNKIITLINLCSFINLPPLNEFGFFYFKLIDVNKYNVMQKQPQD